MQDTQEMQEIEQGQEVQEIDFSIPDGSDMETFNVVWDYWGKPIPDRIRNNLSLIWACVNDTALKNGVPAADLMRGILGGKFSKNGYPIDHTYRALVMRAENMTADENLPEGFSKYYQTTLINELMRLSKRDKFEKRSDYSKEGIYTYSGGKIIFKDFDSIEALTMNNVESIIVFDCLTKKLAANIPHRTNDANKLVKARSVEYSVEEYQAARNIKDYTTAKNAINKAIKYLFEVSFRKNKDGTDFAIHIIEGIATPEENDQESEEESEEEKKKREEEKKKREEKRKQKFKKGEYVENGTVGVIFAYSFIEYLATKGSILILPDAMAQLNIKKYPHAYRIGRKLYLNYRENYGKGRDQEYRLKVSTLLKECPDLPTFEELSKTNRQYKKRIIVPFENNLDALMENGSIKCWHYCNAKGVLLTDEQLFGKLTFQEWLDLRVEFVPVGDYPTEMLERNTAKKIKRSIESKKITEKARVKAAADAIREQQKEERKKKKENN